MIGHLKNYYGYYLIIIGLTLPLLLLEKEVEYIIWALTSVLVVSCLLFIERIRYHKKIRILQHEKYTAELDLLKSQINPHFFFNTLNNLYSLTISNSKKAPEIILKLSDMMRYTIYKGQDEFVTLEEELKYIESFITLQQIRSVETSNVTFTKQISNPKQKVAPLLFIILIENAFKHGLEKLGDEGFVTINFNQAEGEICLTVLNNVILNEEYNPGITLRKD